MEFFLLDRLLLPSPSVYSGVELWCLARRGPVSGFGFWSWLASDIVELWDRGRKWRTLDQRRLVDMAFHNFCTLSRELPGFAHLGAYIQLMLGELALSG